MTFSIYCAGNFIEGETPLEVINPFTGKTFATTWLGGEHHLEEAIKAAVRVSDELKFMPIYRRAEILSEIATGLEENIEDFAAILTSEAGKPWRYATGEALRAIQVFKIAAEECKRLPGEFIPLDLTPAGTNKEGWVKHFPVGPVAAIVPFNFPLNLAIHKIAPAIATGCPIVLKPASGTPLSTLMLARLIDQTSLPKGAVSIIPLDRKTGNKMVTDDRFKLLTFTGSAEVGWKMKEKAGKKKVVLELGGNAGLIVTDTANLDEVVLKAVPGSFAYSGQVCIHTQRIYVHKTVIDTFTKKFVQKTKQLQEGGPSEPETEISVMIDEKNAVRVEEWVNEAVKDGAKVLCGGKRKNSYFEPTVLTNTNQKMKVCSLEIFGPVVTIDPYDTFEQAVEMINNSRFGLQAGVFTDSLKEMDYAFNYIEAGGVIINDIPTFRVDHMPYGGIKDSGLGREGVKYAMLDMLEPKILVK